jgi:hypothetical protein
VKVAIVGLSDSSRHLVPWSDPQWELWGLAWDAERYRYHRVFEMHDMPDLRGFYDEELPAYLEKVGHCSLVYMQEQYPEVPGAVRFPFDDVEAVCGSYWESSIGYAMGLAIAQEAEEIAVYGVDMRATEEYAYQRPNMEYLIGLAKGRGIKVHIPEVSPLMKFSGFDGYHGRYGWRG